MATSATKREQKAPLAAANAEPSNEQIAALAYSLWHERGCPYGSPEVDWLNAERTLKPNAHTDLSVGATENNMNMGATVPQRIDQHGSKVEDLAGTGEQDAPGG